MITKTNNRTLLAMSGVTYDFDFRIDDAAELEVYGITAGGVATQLTTGFTVAFSAADEEGTVTFDAEPSTYAEILMLRNRPYTQTTDIPIRGSFSEEDIEKALDQIVIQIQQLKELIDYCVKLDATSEQLDITLPAPVDGKALLWDGVAGALANSTINIEEFETEAAAAVQAATDAETAQTAAEAAQSAAEAAAATLTLASQAEAEAGTDNVKRMSPLRTAQAIAALVSSVNAKVITATRQYDAANGDVGYTGLGFRPKALVSIGPTRGHLVAGNASVVGFATGAAVGSQAVVYEAEGTKNYNLTTTPFIAIDNGTWNVVGVLKSLDSDGFTITWTKAGTPPSTTQTFAILAIG